ncbi:MAG TPA: SET domain-containing protein-lysine N-methyltransferase [Gemmatimonadaceae bacterium]
MPSTRKPVKTNKRSPKRVQTTRVAAARKPVDHPFELRKSPIQGTGAFATRRIRKGTRIIEYTGERISNDEADKRYDDTKMKRHHTFLFSLDDGTCIDAAVNGNEARYINHSCDPNCQAVIVRKHIYIEAVRTIQPGEELCYDYAYERTGDSDEATERMYVCRCGAPNCRGTILAPKKRKRKRKAGSAK